MTWRGRSGADPVHFQLIRLKSEVMLSPLLLTTYFSAPFKCVIGVFPHCFVWVVAHCAAEERQRGAAASSMRNKPETDK